MYSSDNKGSDKNPCSKEQGTQFPEPAPGISGYGFHTNEKVKDFPFSIVDLVQIPKHLTSGEYVMSFRWDTEQGNQVWNTCATLQLD